MSELPLRFHEDAIAEARAAREWYAERSTAASDSFMAELDKVLERIGQFPEIGSPYLAGTRRCLFLRFPFFVVYRLRPDEIQVIGLAHARRRPGYWKDRLRGLQ